MIDEFEILELVKFDPKIELTDALEPLQSMDSFLEKHFNRALTDDEIEEVLSNYND